MGQASKDKGSRAETQVKELLRKLTNLPFERTPLSGALDAKHGLKSDVYVPQEKNLFSIEVKHYKDTYLDYSILTSSNSTLIGWWKQAKREAQQNKNKPLLIYKHDRSKIFVAFEDEPKELDAYRWMLINHEEGIFYTALLEDWYHAEKPVFIK
jgi:hypothetical protein